MKMKFIIISLTTCLLGQLALACEIPNLENSKEFDGIDCFYDGFARVMQKGKWNHINSKGQKISEVDFDYAWEFHEGMAAVEIKNKWGFINQSGQIAIPLKYDYVWDFRDGQALVQLDGRSFYIDSTNNIIRKTGE